MSLFGELQKAIYNRLLVPLAARSPAVATYYSQAQAAPVFPYVVISEFSRSETSMKESYIPWDVTATCHIWSLEQSIVEVAAIQDQVIDLIASGELVMTNYKEVLGSRLAVSVEVLEELLSNGALVQHGTVKHQWKIDRTQ